MEQKAARENWPRTLQGRAGCTRACRARGAPAPASRPAASLAGLQLGPACAPPGGLLLVATFACPLVPEACVPVSLPMEQVSRVAAQVLISVVSRFQVGLLVPACPVFLNLSRIVHGPMLPLRGHDGSFCWVLAVDLGLDFWDLVRASWGQPSEWVGRLACCEARHSLCTARHLWAVQPAFSQQIAFPLCPRPPDPQVASSEAICLAGVLGVHPVMAPWDSVTRASQALG